MERECHWRGFSRTGHLFGLGQRRGEEAISTLGKHRSKVHTAASAPSEADLRQMWLPGQVEEKIQWNAKSKANTASASE